MKVEKPHPPRELPKEVLAGLDPKLLALYSQLPSQLASLISMLVTEALPQRIHPNRVLKFAYLYAIAQRFSEGDAVSKEHTRRAKLELAAEIHGFETGYRDDVEAKQRYRAGRRARQQIKASSEAFLRRWQAFKQVVQKHRSELPVHAQSRFSDAILREVENALHHMRKVAVLDEEDLARENSSQRERSAIAQAYIWWYLKLPPYRGKWDDMHQLAVAWHMSPAGSVKSFRAVVYRICKGVNGTHVFEKPWESALSEK